MKLLLGVLTGVLFFSYCSPRAAASEKQNCPDECVDPGPWIEFNAFQLKVSVLGQAGYQSWQGRQDRDSHDLQIEVETTDGQKKVSGTILLVGGRVLAVQGPIAEKGYEIDALDGPILYQRLIVSLLSRIYPKGPTDVPGTHSVDFKDDRNGIRFATPSAEGYIAPPWCAKGEINVLSRDEVQYELSLESSGPTPDAQRSVQDLTGKLSKTNSAKIDNGMLLAGWDVFGLGVQTRKDANGTTFDYGVGPPVASYKAVSDIRRKLAADDYPGERDPSKNFTGFWKENCDQAFGLQIMPFGTDGKYSIVFCGPGGCGTPGEDRKSTFISKDPDYEIIGEDTIKVRNADQTWDTYHRCTRDTHPVLKYKDE